MVTLVQYIQYLIGIIFFTSMLSKVSHLNRYFKIIREYDIIRNDRLIFIFAIFNILAEILISASMFFNWYYLEGLILCIFLLILYSTGIVLNLLRGKVNIDCGCGGVFGDHNLSWSLVIRNILLIIIAITTIIIIKSFVLNLIFNFRLLIITIVTVCFYVAYSNLLRIRHELKLFIKGGSSNDSI
jgi:hypothetical protein